MAPSAFVTLCLLALASAAPQTNPENVAKIDALLPEICTLSQGQSDMKVASLVAEGIELLRFTPDDAVVGVLDKIRAGQYCADFSKLESLFLDAVAFVGTPGAFKVMEQEIAAGSVTGERVILYTVAMTPLWPIVEEYKLIATNKGTELIQLVQNIIKDKNINIDAIVKELKKLILLVQNTIKDKNINIDTVVIELNKFFQLIKDTIKDKNINIETIVAELQKILKLVQDTLKDKNITIDTIVTELNKLTQVIQDTLKNQGIDIDIIVEKIKALIQVVLNTIKEKEINIDTIVTEVTKLTQVILDTLNDKGINIDIIVEKLKALVQLVINTIKEKDINIDTITVDLQKLLQLVQDTINTKDINMYTIVKELNKLIELVLNTIKEKDINIDTIVVELKKIIKLVQVTLKDNGINIESLVGELTKLIQPVLDIIKKNNINITTINKTIIRFAKKYLNIDILNLINIIDLNVKHLGVYAIIPVISEAILAAKDINIDAARTGQINLDLLIPTITGFPLKIRLTGTAVIGIKAVNNLNVNKGSLAALLKIIPSLNAYVEAEFGFGEQLSTGLKLKHTVYTTNGLSLSVSQKNGKELELQYELPEKMELFGVQSEVILMKSGEVLNEVQLLSGKVQDIRVVSNKCASIIEPITGLLLCYDINTPNPISSNSLPLSKPMMLRVYLSKSDASMNGYRLAAKLKNKPAKKSLKFEAGIYGADSSKMSALELSYTKGDDTHFIALELKSTLIKSLAEITIINQAEYKSLQMYVNNKFLTLAPVEGKIRIDFKPYQVETYVGLSKSLNENNRIFKIALSILENGELNTANFIAKADFFPIMFEVDVDLPKNAGLAIYKVEKIITRLSVSSVVLESRIVKKSPEVLQANLLLLNAGSALVNIGTAHTLSVDSPIIGGATNKVILITSVTGKFLNTELGINTKLNYENGVFDLASGVKYSGSEVLRVSSQLAFENGAVILSSGITYLDAKALVVKTQLIYAAESLAVSSNIKFYDSELLLVNGKLSLVNGVVQLINEATYLGATVIKVTVEQNLDINNLALKAQVDVPMVGFGILSELSYSNMMIRSSNIAIYAGSEVVNADLKLGYGDGKVFITSKITSELFSRELFYADIEQTVMSFPVFFKSEVTIPALFMVKLHQTIDSAALSTKAQVEIPELIKPLKIDHVFGINSAFSYSVLTDVASGDSVLLHIEGPLSFTFSKALVQQNLDLKVSGAFEGVFKIMHAINLSLKKIEYLVDMRHTNTPIVFINLVLDRSNGKEVTAKSIVKLPLVVESEMIATITTSLIHMHENILALPGTPYARRFKGSCDINWVENIVKGDLYWDADKDADKKIELTTKYALDITALKLIIQGDLIVTTLNFGYKLETSLASPLAWFQGASGTELIITMPTKKIAVAKSIIDIQYAEGKLVLNPVIAFITTNENKYELAASVEMAKLERFLQFAVTSETRLSTPQLQEITLVTLLSNEGKEPSNIITLEMTLKESVISEKLSVKYSMALELQELLSSLSVMKGSTIASLSTRIQLVSGVQHFEIKNELSLPIITLATKMVHKDGTIALTLLKNEKIVIQVYYTMQALTSHTVGIEIPSRKVESIVVFARNQITLKISPEADKPNPKIMEIALRLNIGAGKGQLEALVTSTSLSKEMRLAVELELIETGGETFDLVNVDVQYQVSEAPKLLKVTLKELKKVYLDLVNDGISPDFNRLFRKAQKVLKQAPKYLNSLKDQVTMLVPKYIELVQNYAKDIYQLYKPDVTAMWNTARKELLKYVNIAKTEAPVLLNKYIAILKTTETWKAVQVTLNEIFVNYPVYYDAAIDFYSKVIIPYVAQLTEIVGEVLVLPEFDVTQFIAILKKEVSTIVEKVVPQILNTKIVKLLKEKVIELKTLSLNKITELKTLYPMEFSLLEDVYTNVILPTSSEVVATVGKILAIPDFDYVKYLDLIIADVPVLLSNLNARILNTQIVNKLRATFPVIFIITEDIYSNVILPTLGDIVTLLKSAVKLPIDFEVYLARAKVDVPFLAGRVIQRVLDTQLLKELKASFPTVVEISEDLYTNVIVPSIEDITGVVGKLIALPIVDLQKTVTTYWAFLKAEIPPMLTKIIQRIPATKLVQNLKTLYPMIFELTNDLYTILIVPTATDIVTVLDKLINIPISDIQVAGKRYWNILKVEIPTLMGKVLERLPQTQIYLMAKVKTTELLQLVQGKLEELKAQYPDVVALILDFYNQVAIPAYSDLAIIYGKLVKVSDVYQIRDVLVTEVVVFLTNLQKNLNKTTAMNIVISKLSELLSKLSELLLQLHEQLTPFPEYQTLLKKYTEISEFALKNYNQIIEAALKLYEQVIQITPNDILTPLKAYFVDYLGFSFTVTAEKLTATFPLLVSLKDVRYSYQVLTVAVPAYVLEQLTELGAQLLPQARLVYEYIEENSVVIVDYIKTQAPVYIQLTQDYLNTLKVLIPQYIEKIQASIPKYIQDLQTLLLPYIEQLKTTVITYFELARNSAYVKLAQKKVQEIVEILMTKLDEILNLYPKEYQAVKDFLSLYMNICLDYATWAMNVVVEYPPVTKAITFIMALTPEKLQEFLNMFKELALSTMSQIVAVAKDLIADLPKDIPAFIEMYIPAFIISFVKSIISYLS